MSEARYKVIKGSQSAHCCFEWTVVDTMRKAMYTASGFEAVCECFDEIDADKIVGALNSSQARLSEAVKVLEPFAKCSEVYPLADGERDAGFAGLHDSRCPLKIEDYHAARQFIDTIKGDK